VFTLYFLYDHSCLRNLTSQAEVKKVNAKRKRQKTKQKTAWKTAQYGGSGKKKVTESTEL